jgi:hypothetical protein
MRNPGHFHGFGGSDGHRATGQQAGRFSRWAKSRSEAIPGREVVICHPSARDTRCGTTETSRFSIIASRLAAGGYNVLTWRGRCKPDKQDKTAEIRMAPLSPGWKVWVWGPRVPAGVKKKRFGTKVPFKPPIRSCKQIHKASTQPYASSWGVPECCSTGHSLGWGNCSTEHSEQERPIIPGALDFALTVQSNRQMWMFFFAVRRANCGWKNWDMGSV